MGVSVVEKGREGKRRRCTNVSPLRVLEKRSTHVLRSSFWFLYTQLFSSWEWNLAEGSSERTDSMVEREQERRIPRWECLLALFPISANWILR